MTTRILSPCGMLGYGFPLDSYQNALAQQPHAIVVDAGSTDAGPHKLGAGQAIVSRMACKKDLERLMTGARDLAIPLLIGSAGGSGARQHVEWTYDIIREIAREMRWPVRIAIVWADISKETILKELRRGNIEKMTPNVPELTPDALEASSGIVGQMGVEPVIRALSQGAQIILCGRAFDPAPFAAVCISRGHDKALSYHLGKILECGALCAQPGSAKDCIMGSIDESGFEVWPTNPGRACTPVSVAAHTFYEKSHPFVQRGPGIELDMEHCWFNRAGEARVRVTGSRIREIPYTIKLEGARLVAYRAFVPAGIRDPFLIAQIDNVEMEVQAQVRQYYSDIEAHRFRINFYHYGLDGVMGNLETERQLPHEIGLLMEVLADSQELANAVCSTLRSTYLHHGYKGRKSTAGNLAFPFAPSDIPFGPVYEFSVYHLMGTGDPNALFPMELREV